MQAKSQPSYRVLAHENVMGNVDNPCIDVMSHTPDETTSKPNLIVIGLLRLQQRLEELDRLCNNEVSNLSRELAQLRANADFLISVTIIATSSGEVVARMGKPCAGSSLKYCSIRIELGWGQRGDGYGQKSVVSPH